MTANAIMSTQQSPVRPQATPAGPDAQSRNAP